MSNDLPLTEEDKLTMHRSMKRGMPALTPEQEADVLARMRPGDAISSSRGTRGSGRLSDFISTLNLSTSELETRLLLVRCRARRLEALYDALPRDLPPQADAALVELVDALAEKEGM